MNLRWLPALILLFTLSSCFQVIEEINLNTDNSGTAAITLNLSQSKSKVAAILLMDKSNGYDVPSREEMQKALNDACADLRKSEGISNVSNAIDFKNFIASIRFSFKNVANVNQIMKKLLTDLDVKGANQSVYTYNSREGSFSRDYKYAPEAKKAYSELKADDKKVFQNARYVSIYRFDKPVQSSSNKLSKISSSGKAVMMQCSVLDLINGSVNLSTKINLGK